MKRLFLFSLVLLAGVVSAQTPRQALLTWTPVTTTVDGDAVSGPVSYKVYQGPKGGTKSVVQTLSALTVTINLPVGETCFQVSASTTVNGESALSAEGCKSLAPGKPGAPTLTVQ